MRPRPLRWPTVKGVDALMVADDFASGGDEFAGGVGEGLALLVEVGTCRKVLSSPPGMKRIFLRVGLGGYVEAGVRGHDADGGLIHLAEREEGAA